MTVSTVHLISVGRSLLDAFAEPRRSFTDLTAQLNRYKPHTLVADLGDDTAALHRRLTQWLPPNGTLPPEVAERIAGTEPARWPTTAGAERQTFVRVTGRRTVAADEQVVLLATDTITGLHAGFWCAIGLTAGDLASVSYCDDPAMITRRPGVTLTRITGMDAGTEAGFTAAMRQLGLLGRRLLPTKNEPAVRFHVHLSGGFKAAIPYLIGLAEGLRAYEPRPVAAVDAYVLHESTSGTAIRLPLRRLPLDELREELAAFRDGVLDRQLPEALTMDGYAYSRDQGRWTLTPYGAGLQALFGVSAEHIGGS